MTRIVPLLLLALAVPALADGGDPRTLLQLADYVGVDYKEAVSGGVVADDAEYAEMQEFSRRIAILARELSDHGQVIDDADRLAALIAARAPAGDVSAAASQLRERVLEEHPVVITPANAPDLEQARALYAKNCAACHGASGHGDGPAAQNLDPSPTDFHNRERAAQRSLYGLYSVITLGVDGTAMQAFDGLSHDARWSLAFYVGGLAASAEDLAAGAAELDRGTPPLDARKLVTSAPWTLARDGQRDAMALAFYLRQHPAPSFTTTRTPLDIARDKTELAVAQVRSGDPDAAYASALSAYLDGFELAESSVSAIDVNLKRRIETDMAAMRDVVRGDNLPNVEQQAAIVLRDLNEARHLLEETTLKPGVVFASALVILLREGLEAILVLAAIAAFMIKTGRRDALRYMHAGWIAALLLGVVTWVVSTWLLQIGGATRELTEGLTALFAALMLLYVGFWMHNKMQAERWNRFLRDQVGQALEGGTLWTLTLMSFVAVYREVFETVLFYEALWTQTDSAGQGMIAGGAGAAAVLLVVLAWGIFKLGVRLPLKQFFGVSAIAMIVLAVIFAGKGVAALQEAGTLPSDTIALLPRIELLGIYPNWQGIGLQLAIAVLSIALLRRQRRPA